MMIRRNNAQRPLCVIAVLGLFLRSLVAPGLMLVDGAKGFGGLALVLCPTQNRGLSLESLSSDDTGHHHRHHVFVDNTQSSHPEPAKSTGVHAESLESGCALWAGSATAPLRTASPFFAVAFATSHQHDLGFDAVVPRQVPGGTQPRAPPTVL
jgi:hypothetical protein